MLPLDKVQGLISKHSELEKDLSSGEIDKNTFAIKSKEYSNLNEIIDEVGADAIRFIMLTRKNDQVLDFDFDKVKGIFTKDKKIEVVATINLDENETK